MKLILQTAADSAVVNGATVTGPLHLDVDQAEVSAVTYNRGVVLVSDGTATQVAEMTEAGIWSLFASVLLGLAAGIHMAKQWVTRFGVLVISGAGIASADYTTYSHTETITNSTAELIRKRLRVYERVTSPASTEYYIAGKSYSRSVNGGTTTYDLRLGKLKSGTYTWQTASDRRTQSASSVVTGTVPEAIIENGGVYIWFFKYDWQSWGGSPQALWSNLAYHINNTTGDSNTVLSRSIGGESTRGELRQEWPIDVEPHAAKTVFLERDFPFYLVVDNATAYLDEYGDYHEEWDEEDEHTSTTITQATPPNDQTRVTPEGPGYSSGPDPESATRPTDVSGNEGMNDAAEARHTELQAWLKDIKEGTDAGVNQSAAAAALARADAAGIKAATTAAGTAAAAAAGAAGDQVTGAVEAAASTAHADAQATKDSLDEMTGETGGDPGMGDEEEGGFNDSRTEALSTKEGLKGALLGLGDEVGAFIGVFNLTVSGAAYPVVTLPIPSMLGGGTLTMDFGDYGDFWSVLRVILLIVAGWGFASAILENIRQAVS